MNKKLFVFSSLLVLMLSACNGGSGSSTIRPGEGGPRGEEVNQDIKALSHYNDEIVPILPQSVRTYYKGDATNTEWLENCYEYNSEIASYSSNFITKSDDIATRASKKAQAQALYDKWDGYHPINRTLYWSCSLANVTGYDVVLSFDDCLTRVVEDVEVSEPNYTMKNLYANQDYYWQVRAKNNDQIISYSQIFHFTTENNTRTVYIPGVCNTRDIGGYTTSFGTIQQGLVYRGARLDEISDEGLRIFKDELKIKTDIDLRASNEGPSLNPTSVANYVGPIDCSYYRQIDADLNPTGYIAAREKIRDAIKPFANKDNYPIYFHCTIGRDRTGTIGMILDALLGASEDKIYNNYYTSCFSTCGAITKPIAEGTANEVIGTVDCLKKEEGTSLAEKTMNFLLKCGLTKEEITSIRNIMTGKVDGVGSSIYTWKDVYNTEGKVFITYIEEGEKDHILTIDSGTKLVSPTVNHDYYQWFNGNTLFDFSQPVTKSIRLVAKKASTFDIKLHFINGEFSDKTISIVEGTVLNFEEYKLVDKNLCVVLDSGEEISTFTVTRNATINIQYLA